MFKSPIYLFVFSMIFASFSLAQTWDYFQKSKNKSPFEFSAQNLFGWQPVAKPVVVDQKQLLEKNNEECSEIELEKKGGVLEKVPYLDQSGGTCYANTVSTMYDAYRILNREKNASISSSPADISYTLSKRKKKSGVDGGQVIEISHLFKNPPCPFDDKKVVVDKLNKEQMALKLTKAQAGLNAVAEGSEIPSNATVARFASDSSRIKNRYYNHMNACFSEQVSFPAQRKNFNEILDIVKNRDLIKAAEVPMAQFCSVQERLKSSKPIVVDRRYATFDEMSLNKITTTQATMLNDIHAELNRGLKQALPVGFTFCSNILYEGPKYVIKYKINTADDLSDKACGMHAVVISGRRKNPKTGRCEFKMRNSSVDCSTMSKKFECNPKTGEVWFDIQTLGRTSYSTVKIKH